MGKFMGRFIGIRKLTFCFFTATALASLGHAQDLSFDDSLSEDLPVSEAPVVLMGDDFATILSSATCTQLQADRLKEAGCDPMPPATTSKGKCCKLIKDAFTNKPGVSCGGSIDDARARCEDETTAGGCSHYTWDYPDGPCKLKFGVPNPLPAGCPTLETVPPAVKTQFRCK